jgi:hypothetical protein
VVVEVELYDLTQVKGNGTVNEAAQGATVVIDSSKTSKK